MLVRLGWVVLLAGAVVGCSEREPGESSAGEGRDGGGGSPGVDGGLPPVVSVDSSVPPATDSCQKMDILFIIDDSGSMAEEQMNLVQNFPRFIEVLDSYTTAAGPLDYRVAVTTTGKDVTVVTSFPALLPGLPAPPPIEDTETGPNGEFLQREACGMSRRWIERGDPDVTSTFSCLAEVGTSGSPVEMPLKVLDLAVGERVAEGTNAGFLREDALLAIVILTDEDDCSYDSDRVERNLPNPFSGSSMVDECDPENPALTSLSTVLDGLDAAKGERGRWAVSIIAGPGPGSCMSEFGEAFEGVRLKQFIQQVGENTNFSSICDGDLAGSLMQTLDTFDAACQSFPPLI